MQESQRWDGISSWKSAYLWQAYLEKWKKKGSFDAQRKIRYWNIEIEDYNERLSRRAVPALIYPWTVLLWALCWSFHFCWHFRVLSQGTYSKSLMILLACEHWENPLGWVALAGAGGGQIVSGRTGRDIGQVTAIVCGVLDLSLRETLGFGPMKDSPVNPFCWAGMGNCSLRILRSLWEMCGHTSFLFPFHFVFFLKLHNEQNLPHSAPGN